MKTFFSDASVITRMLPVEYLENLDVSYHENDSDDTAISYNLSRRLTATKLTSDFIDNVKATETKYTATM